ncbi:3-methyl-2-oxobutanoate hydroxymethyltransferase [Oryzomicrobium terrae]|uniref:3-methyl-2-oxobutanoate hydroxymethyltransferase n=1 Tax=Oryzomicrobium terrae TaxID=1735038 RepID=A0A5C1EA40_9RHOO|nr:3-methyl-2-oxobutanoate hydroxymethyltransferase [Oryzomicrobium terrae]QEL65851.1 3-methyl-2-oxobutanoate hydroxymethyltransferase [Oryzomicrobium terrae]
MSVHADTRRLTTADLAKMKAAGDKIAMLTCYDASFARLCDDAGVDSLLIGDSLGMVLQGHESTLPVTLADIAYHTAAVARGSKRPLIIADMPFGTSQVTPEDTFRNAVPLLAAGAQVVKIEGGVEMAETVRFLTSRGVPVCGHIGLTPQSVHQLGGYRVQGKTDAAAEKLKADALALQDAGASLIVLEAIPEALAQAVTDLIAIPTIGIGASAHCSGQVLVLHDMLDLSPGKKARFVKNFMAGQPSVAAAIAAYVAAVKDASFPGPEHCY